MSGKRNDPSSALTGSRPRDRPAVGVSAEPRLELRVRAARLVALAVVAAAVLIGAVLAAAGRLGAIPTFFGVVLISISGVVLLWTYVGSWWETPS